MKEVKRKQFYVFSPFLRIFHWIMVVAILILFFTGIVIATPWQAFNLEPALSLTYMDLVRDVHFVVAFIFLASFILKIYGFIINKGDRLFPHFWKGYFYSQTVEVAMHYMFLKYEHSSFLRNPLARSSYAFLYVLVAVEFVTGFAMYYLANPASTLGYLSGLVVTACGGEMMVHYIHHYVAWIIILFAIGHLYMVVRSEFMEGESEVSSMFSGYKFLVHYPKDANDAELVDEHHLV